MSDNKTSPTSEDTTLKKTTKHFTPQQSIDRFWKKSIIEHPGKAFTVLPKNLGAKRAVAQAPRGPATSKNAASSYDQAAAICKANVEKVVQECRRLNQKYQDLDFDIEFDLSMWRKHKRTENCLVALGNEEAGLRPMSVKRVEDIFDDPHFYVEGMTANNVRQGYADDCWFLSAICTLANKEDLLEKICCARDENVGVYASNPDFQALTLDDISDDGLSWCSDIDAPLDSSSEHDSDSDTDEPAPSTIDSSESTKDSPESTKDSSESTKDSSESTKDSSESSQNLARDTKNDPWNAVCVVALRVYSRESGVEIEVVNGEDEGGIY